MSIFSPIAAGFRTMVQRPGLLARELAWRWTWGGTTLALVWFTFREYLRSLIVTDTDLLLLRTGQPLLAGQAISSIFRGSGERLQAVLLLVGLASALLWIVMATLGRGVVGRKLLLHPQQLPAIRPLDKSDGVARQFVAMLSLQTLRAVLYLSFWFALYGAAVLLQQLLPAENFALFTLLYLNAFMLLWAAWTLVNWLLSLATLFAAGQGAGPLAALTSVVELWRRCRSAMTATGMVFGLLHLAALVALYSVLFLPLAFATAVPGVAVLAGMGFILLIYFVVADVIYLARLAAYASMVNGDQGRTESISRDVSSPAAHSAA